MLATDVSRVQTVSETGAVQFFTKRTVVDFYVLMWRPHALSTHTHTLSCHDVTLLSAAGQEDVHRMQQHVCIFFIVILTIWYVQSLVTLKSDIVFG